MSASCDGIGGNNMGTGGTGGTASGGGGGGSGGGGGGGGGNTGGGWWSDFTSTFVDEAKNLGNGFVDQIGSTLSNTWNCVTLDGTCSEMAQGLYAATPNGMITAAGEGLVARSSEIYNDFDNGRSAQGAAKIAFDIVIAAVTGKVGGKIAGKCHSFLPGTGVLLADGTRKAIDDVEIGDLVLTTDTETGETVEKKVVSTITTEDDKDFTEITISTKGDLSSIVATDTHPFWVPELKKWIKAGDLQVGQWLRTSAGTHVQITAVSYYTKRQRTHDLTIDDVHAYYVLAGATPVLVHNCNLSARASEIHAAEPDPFVRKNVSTVAVVRADTPHGPINVVAGSGDGLTPAQMTAVGRGEIVADNIPGTHAEQNALLFINEVGWTPVAGGASRNVCLGWCAPLIRGTGGRMMGNVEPGNGKTTTRQRSFEW
jgi:hypothetical protein